MLASACERVVTIRFARRNGTPCPVVEPPKRVETQTNRPENSGAMRPRIGDITGQAVYPIHDLDAIAVMVRTEPADGRPLGHLWLGLLRACK